MKTGPPIPQLDLWESLSYLSGDNVKPYANDPQWSALSLKIEESPHSAFEYLYYVVHFSSDNGESFRHTCLKLKNMVCSPKMWSRFVEFLPVMASEMKVKMHLQKDILNTSARNEKLIEVLLNPVYEIGPSLRVESALQMIGMGNPEYYSVLKKWGVRAGELLMGISAVHEYVPKTISTLREGSKDVARFLFPGYSR